MKKILVTGSSGLVGSEVCVHFAGKGYEIHGMDNNQRAIFFGPSGDTRWNQQRLEKDLKNFRHHEMDIRNRQGILDKVKEIKPGWCRLVSMHVITLNSILKKQENSC